MTISSGNRSLSPHSGTASSGFLSRDDLFIEETRLLNKNLIVVIFGSSAAMLLILVLLRNAIPIPHLLGWFGVNIALLLCRVPLHLHFRKIDGDIAGVKLWFRIYVFFIFLSGITWGYAGFFFLIGDDEVSRIAITLILGGLAISSIATYSTVIWLPYVFFVPAVLPLSIRYSLLGGDVNQQLSALMVIFLLLMTLINRNLNRLARDAFHLLFEKKNLVEDLKEDRDRIEKMNVRMEKILSEVRRTEKDLQQFKKTLDVTLDCVFMFDPETLRFLYANQGGIDLVGYRLEDIQTMTPINLLTEFNEGEFRQRIAVLIEGIQPSITFESFFRNKNGRVFPVEIFLQYVSLSDDVPPRFVGIVRDITERKLAEKELYRAKELAEEASRVKTKFLSSVSHDLRTPLNSILGFSQILLSDERDSLSEHQYEQISMIHNGGQILLGMIDDLLDFSMIEDGSITFMRDAEAPDRIIHEILYLYESDIRSMGITVENRIDEKSPPPIRVDRNRFRQIMINIISNSIKYNRKNGRIELWFEIRDDNMLRICISDAGEGIHRNRIHQVFQPFSRLGKEHSEIEGTGIGLAISKKLTEMMNGNIGFTSEYGHGSVFWVEFPISGSADRLPISDTRRRNGDRPVEITEESDRVEKQHLILYIEDNPVNMLLIEKILERQKGFRMLGVSNAEMGIELARERRPEIILMDINLPGMSGYEAMRELKKFRETENIPVIAVSANVMASEIEMGRKEGFADYLVKPLDIDQIMVTLNRHLKKS